MACRGLLVLVALAILAGGAAAGSSRRERPALASSCGNIDDYAHEWSPDGRWLLFTRAIESGGVDSGIYRIRVDGKQLRRLTPDSEYSYGAVWSPDGSHVAYSSFDDFAVVSVVVARSDGTGAKVVGSFQGLREPPWTYLAWAPGGRELAYAADALYVVGADGSSMRTIARGGLQPAWSPDGKRIAFATFEDGVVVADASGANAHPVAADGAFPAWAPDGQRLAYQARFGSGVTVMGADGSKRRVDRSGLAPRWSPDGTRIVDVSQPTRGRYAVRVVDLRTGRVKTISHDSSRRFGADDYDAHFSPDGKTVAFTSDALSGSPQVGGSEIRFVRADGRNERRLTYHCNFVEGGFGARIDGTWLPDVMVGSSGHDTIVGWGGDDTIYARDRREDTIRCGRGRDLVYADRADLVARDCESVTRR